MDIEQLRQTINCRLALDAQAARLPHAGSGALRRCNAEIHIANLLGQGIDFIGGGRDAVVDLAVKILDATV